MGMFEIREYVENERSPFADWHKWLDPVTVACVDTCIRRLKLGNFGAAKRLRGGDKRRLSADIAAAVRRWENYLKGR